MGPVFKPQRDQTQRTQHGAIKGTPKQGTNHPSDPPCSTQRHSHINYQDRLPPVSVPNEVPQVLGVRCGDGQRVHHMKVGLKKKSKNVHLDDGTVLLLAWMTYSTYLTHFRA